MRSSRVIISALTLATLATVPSVAHSGWSTEPVTISPTTANIPLVEGCTDGAHGTFVAWQQETSPGVGTLRVQHLTVSGDLAPLWPALGIALAVPPAARTRLSALPDRLGGCYLFWEEGGSLVALRIDATGAAASGWPAGGRFLGTLSIDSPQISVIEDGAHGFYAAWVSGNQVVMAIHLGSNNTGAGGWPNAARNYTPFGDGLESYWAQVALAPDGGAYLAYATWDGNTPSGSWRLRRLTTAGLTSSGWPSTGISFGDFHRDYLQGVTELALLGLSEDGRGGAFVVIANPTDGEPDHTMLETRLYRIQGDGTTAADWPAAGRVHPSAQSSLQTTDPDGPPDASFRVLSDHVDGALVASFSVASDGPLSMYFNDCSASGEWNGQLGAFVGYGYELVPRGDGGFFLADFYPRGPNGPWQPSAYLDVSGSQPSATLITESHEEIVVTFYGDIGLASTEDGGAVFLWSQVRDRVGLFARKVNAFGEVTGVPPATGAAAGLRRLLFVQGAGIQAALSAPGGGRLDLFDLAGRRLSSLGIGGDDREVTLPGTAEIPSGLYFARLRSAAGQFSGKVLVAR